MEPLLTYQDMFNVVWNHFVVNKGKKSYNIMGDSSCKYRDASGNKCAIGLFIPDEMYTPEYESRSFVWVYERIRKYISEDVDYVDFRALQNAHDGPEGGITFTSAITGRLRDLAEKYKLSIPEGKEDAQ